MYTLRDVLNKLYGTCDTDKNSKHDTNKFQTSVLFH